MAKNPEFGIAIAYVNGEGKVVRFLRPDMTEYERKDYHEEENKKIPDGAFIITPNNCRWRLVDGKWRCL